jgi:hypothetical protein
MSTVHIRVESRLVTNMNTFTLSIRQPTIPLYLLQNNKNPHTYTSLQVYPIPITYITPIKHLANLLHFHSNSMLQYLLENHNQTACPVSHQGRLMSLPFSLVEVKPDQQSHHLVQQVIILLTPLVSQHGGR